MPNALKEESSPYLLQHAHNPVDWQPWGDAAWAQALAENKLVLLSIGYSACHWCHVMEHESFQDEEVAALMNANLVCIKIDREERPDVDQVYMEAVQMMRGQGGWPLNCFALPDGRPVYGGTYFPKTQWLAIIRQLSELWANQPEKFYQYAERMTHQLRQGAELRAPLLEHSPAYSLTVQMEAWLNLNPQMDGVWGGFARAPKFPLPVVFRWLLEMRHLMNAQTQAAVDSKICLTLDKMAEGGLYDQVGGGFARYSVDAYWHVPHFEKMLYDNAQLISLYSLAARLFPDKGYGKVVCESLDFVARELRAGDGGFFAALDADSEGVEGKFYAWTHQQFAEAAGPDAEWAAAWYDVQDGQGNWEHGLNVLRRLPAGEARARTIKPKLSGQDLDILNARLLEARSQRVRPGLDYKILTAWNAQMILAGFKAWLQLGLSQGYDMALAALENLWALHRRDDGGLWHTRTPDTPARINAFLDDYALLIEALLLAAGATARVQWLEWATQLCEYCLEHFYDEQKGLFYFTSDLDPPLAARKLDVQDNVLPAGNSTMAHNLLSLGILLGKPQWVQKAERQLSALGPAPGAHPGSFANWLRLHARLAQPTGELVVIGTGAANALARLAPKLPLNMLLAASEGPSELPPFAGRWQQGRLQYYYCRHGACQLPVDSEMALLALVNAEEN